MYYKTHKGRNLQGLQSLLWTNTSLVVITTCYDIW